MEELSVIVVDDHPLFRKGVIDALSIQQGIKVIGEAADGKTALALIRGRKPEIAIVDINLPAVNGLQVTHQVNLERLPTKIILLTAYDDYDQIIHAAWAGACAYCSKDVDPNHLIDTLNQVSQGNYVIQDKVFSRPDFLAWLNVQMEQARHLYSEPGSPFHPLSAREMDVLNCVVQGMSNKEIASHLGISHQTVKNHVTSILRKFNVDDRTQAVVYALKHGWVSISEGKDKAKQE